MIIDLKLASNNIQARVSVTGRSQLRLDFNQEMGTWGRHFSQAVKFPRQICGGTNDNALSATQTYIADFKTSATNLDLNIDCKSFTYFENSNGEP